MKNIRPRNNRSIMGWEGIEKLLKAINIFVILIAVQFHWYVKIDHMLHFK